MMQKCDAFSLKNTRRKTSRPQFPDIPFLLGRLQRLAQRMLNVDYKNNLKYIV